MKKAWKTKRLGELCEFHRGLTYTKGDEVETSNNIVLRATNINLEANLLDFAELKFINDKVVVPNNKKVRKDSLLICTASGSKRHLGKVAYIDDDYGYAFGGFMGMITPRSGLIPKYLFHLMTSGVYKDFIGALSEGANINNLKFDDLKTFQVPHPDPTEQQRIVGILDEAFEGLATAKANAEKNLAHARELFQSGYITIFNEMVTGDYQQKTVADIAHPAKGSMRTGPFGSQLLHSEFVEYGVAVLGIDNAVNNEFRWDKKRYITNEKYKELSRYRVKPGDVLITIMGTCGRCAIVPEDISTAINTKHLCCITLDASQCLPAFLHGYFLYHPIAQQFIAARAKGSIMAGLNMGIISELPVLLPSLKQQQDITETVGSLREGTQRLESIYQRKLERLEALKKSLLHHAFTGQL